MTARGIGEPGDRARRIGGRFVTDRVHRAGRADGDDDVAGGEPHSERPGHVVAGARRDESPSPLTGDSGGSEHRRHHRRPVAIGIDDRQQVVAVGLGCGRPVAGARGIASVGDHPAGHLQRQPVVRQEDAGQPLPRLRFTAVQPRQLGDREAGDGDEAARLGPTPAPPGELTDQPRRVRRRFGVVPQLCRPDDVVALVEGDHPVLLPGDADRRDRRLAGLLPRRLEGRPPRRRVLLGARRLGRADGEPSRARRRPRSRGRAPRPWSRWSRSRRRRRAPSADARHVAGDEVLQPFLPAGHARRRAAVERPLVQCGEIGGAVEDRSSQRAVPCRVAGLAGRRRARHGRRRRRAAPGPSCPSRRCGRGTGRRGRSTGDAAWRRSSTRRS